MLRAAFFDVGDTLVEHWTPREEIGTLIRDALRAEFGERAWYEDLIGADIEPSDPEDPLLQETNRWYEAWFAAAGIEPVDIDRVRSAFAIPIDLVSTPVPGAADAVRWCKARGLSVVLVTNTLSRGDAEVLRDWERLGLGREIDGVVSSHSVGWRKPHPAMFERALEIAHARPEEAFMVGDSLEADVAGAKRLGLRAIWRKVPGREPPAEPPAAPDATIETLHELPAVVAPWISGRGSATIPTP